MIFKRVKTDIKRFIKRAKNFDPFETEAYDELIPLLESDAKKVKKGRLGLNLLLISDTHCELAFGKEKFFEYVKKTDFDLCVLLGDIESAELEIILEAIPRKKIIALKGNHDSFDQYAKKGIHEISGDVFKYKGVTFAGIDGSFKYKPKKFPSHTQYESLTLAQKLIKRCKKIDVVLSHDSMFTASQGEFAHLGLVGVTYLVMKSGAKWHFHGHIHKTYLKEYKNGTKEKSILMYECVSI